MWIALSMLFLYFFLHLQKKKWFLKQHINFTSKGIYGKMEHPDADFNNQKVIFEGMYWNKKNGDLDKLPVSASLNLVIPLGFEPKTHSLEGCCSNPTELRNHHKSGAKVGIFMCTTKFSVKNILISFVFQSFCTNGYKKRKSSWDFLMRCVRDSNPWPPAWQAGILTRLN